MYEPGENRIRQPDKHDEPEGLVREIGERDRRRPTMRILVATAWVSFLSPHATEGYRLYKSARIKAVYNRRGKHDMAILSAEYGLFDAHEVKAPYQRVMDENRCQYLMSDIVRKVSQYDFVVYFKGRARREYHECIKEACRRASKPFVSFGYANMGDIGELEAILDLVSKKQFGKLRKKLGSMSHVYTCNLP